MKAYSYPKVGWTLLSFPQRKVFKMSVLLCTKAQISCKNLPKTFCTNSENYQICNSEWCQYVFWKHTQTGCIRHHFPAGLVSGKQKNFRIKVEAIQQRRRPHISAMRQAEYTKDEAADWSLGQEEWSIRSAILQNELFVLIHLSGKIKTIKYYFTVLLNM